MAREERFVHFQNRNFTVRGDIGFFFFFSPWFKGDAAFFTDSPSSSPFGSPVARKRVFTRTLAAYRRHFRARRTQRRAEGKARTRGGE
jgi:hypothetical protein